jgi:hypothetical protein
MFVIAKLPLVTSAFYVGIAIALEALLLGLMYWKGGLFYTINFKGWAVLFVLIWLASFALAWRVMMVPFPFPWSRSTNTGPLNPAQRNRDSTNEGSCRSYVVNREAKRLRQLWQRR